MTPKSIRDYLRQLCQDFDEGRPVRPYLACKVGAIAIPAAIALSGINGCCGDVVQDVYGAPFDAPPEVCDDSADNDEDGLTDCADPNCATDPACPNGLLEPSPTVYGAPMPMDGSPDEVQPEPPPPEPPTPAVPAYGRPFPDRPPPNKQPQPNVEQPVAPEPNQNFPVPPYAAPFPRGEGRRGTTAPEGLLEPPPASGAYAAPFPNDTPLM